VPKTPSTLREGVKFRRPFFFGFTSAADRLQTSFSLDRSRSLGGGWSTSASRLGEEC